jgi:hypothetical protein
MPSRRALAALLAALAPLGAAAEPVLVERILAVVDGRPIVLSEVRAVEELDGIPRAQAQERVIDETLLFAEAFRLPQARTSPVEDEAALAALGRAGQPAYRRAAHRRAVIRKYAAFRFRPPVRIEESEVRAAYANRWRGDPQAPPFEAESPQIRERMVQAGVDARLAEWVRELRAAARIRVNTP